jgi:hypothetical protein
MYGTGVESYNKITKTELSIDRNNDVEMLISMVMTVTNTKLKMVVDDVVEIAAILSILNR